MARVSKSKETDGATDGDDNEKEADETANDGCRYDRVFDAVAVLVVRAVAVRVAGPRSLKMLVNKVDLSFGTYQGARMHLPSLQRKAPFSGRQS